MLEQLAQVAEVVRVEEELKERRRGEGVRCVLCVERRGDSRAWRPSDCSSSVWRKRASIAASSLKCETKPTYGCRAPPVMPAPTLAAGECTDILREPLLNEIPPSAGSDAFDSLAFSGDGASAV